MGAGEGALFVPEQFAFQQGFGDGAAIDRHKLSLLAAAFPVNGQGRHFFPRPALSQDEYRRVGRRHFAD